MLVVVVGQVAVVVVTSSTRRERWTFRRSLARWTAVSLKGPR